MIRFIDSKNGTVIDTSTNLMWQQGKGEKFTFEEARKYAASLTLAGHNNWRLPTIEELLSLVDYNRRNSAINPIFECESSYYWSSTVVSNVPYGVWGVHFIYGYDGWGHKDCYYYARCVRVRSTFYPRQWLVRFWQLQLRSLCARY